MSSSGSTNELVIFDGDDTLWASQELYEDAKRSIKTMLGAAGYDDEAWVAALEEIDLARVPRFGWDPSRFPSSCVIAYRKQALESGTDPEAMMSAQIHELAAGVFTSRAKVADGAELVLGRLRRRFRMALLTQGNREVQQRRIEASGLAAFFDSIDIVDKKSERSFVDVIERHDASATRSWSVGNSLRSDVYPAQSLGLNAIWLHGRGWAYDRAYDVRFGQTHPGVESLLEAEAILVGADIAIPTG